MSWVRTGDTSATYSRLLAACARADAPDGAKPMVFGFVSLLGIFSTAEDLDYVVGLGQIREAGGECWRWLLEACVGSGLLTKNRKKLHGQESYTLVADPKFIHIRLKADKDWDNQQRNETRDPMIGARVRLRDGDNCRYCGRRVTWRGPHSAGAGTLDHLDSTPRPDGTRPEATWRTMVVACLACNSAIGDKGGDDRPPLLEEPKNPHYGKVTLALLIEHRLLEPDGQRPAQAATASKRRKRPATAEPARQSASEPHSGPRADLASTANAPPESLRSQSETRQVDESDCAGTGRDGPGSGSLLPPTPTSTLNGARRKRSRRGGQREVTP